jgi:ABC-type nitrate/sulfonate/bicarbonate transport system substrate-binding protein
LFTHLGHDGIGAALGGCDDDTAQQERMRLNRSTRKPLKIGFVPLADSAPIVIAHERRLFAKYGLCVQLSREVGWATIRDKIIYGELDAAHALGAMPFAATLGLGSIACNCLTALVLNLNGNAITLSQELWERGVRDAKSLHAEIDASRGKRTYILGVAFPYSSHNFLLRQWLVSGGINPDRDVRIVVVPAPTMFDNLKARNLDGYCGGEPWTSVAVLNGLGWCPVASAQLAPFHPEKVLMVRSRFAEEHESEHLALIAALLEAAAYCDRIENREQVIATLAHPKYVNVRAEALQNSFVDRFNFGNGRVESLPDFHVFSRDDANEPSAEKAAWVLRQLSPGRAAKDHTGPKLDIAHQVFRRDIFQEAASLLASGANEHDMSNRKTAAGAFR